MNERIYLSTADVGSLEERCVINAMRSGWIAPLGPDVDAFEREMAARAGVEHAVLLSSGTAALHCVLVAWGIGPGDVVPTSTMTFVATANAIAYTGAEPFFVDCLRATGNVDPVLMEQAIEGLSKRNERIGAVISVDLFGKTADYTAIESLAERFRVRLLVDAAESVGASHRGRPAGSFGDAAIFSFNGNKIMTTSGGGMVVTDDGELASRVRYLASQARQPQNHYEHTEVGYNYRLSNLLAALGRAQLTRLDEMIGRRRLVRDTYRRLFAAVPGVTLFGAHDDEEDNVWLTSIVVDPEVAGWSTHDLSRALSEKNIESRPLWKPMHLQPVFRGARALVSGAAQSLFENGLTLPSGSALHRHQLDRIESAISAFVGEHA